MKPQITFIGILSILAIFALAPTAFAASTTYTQTAETYPAPDDCPPMCGPMICVICTNTTTAAPQQIAQEVSLLVPDTTPITDYGIVARDEFGLPITLADGTVLRFDQCATCPGPEGESPAPAGYVWINFKSQEMPVGNGVFRYVPHPNGPPGTPLPMMFWVSDTGDDMYGNTVTNLLSDYPQGPVSNTAALWGDVKVMFLDQ